MGTVQEELSDFVAQTDQRSQIVDFLLQHTHDSLRSSDGKLIGALDYILSKPGKLLRPQLVLDACQAAGGDPDLVFPAAAGTEYGHLASLIHDDIMDGDHERRGQETLHVKYDISVPILTGDLLIFQTFLCYTQCFELGVSAENIVAAIRLLSTTCIEMCEGQSLEESIAGNLDIPEETYFEVIRLKTASFCRTAAQIGALLGGAKEEAIATLREYGSNLGTAFQIADDLLSYEGNSLRVGKPLNSDLRNKRITLPIIYALQSDTPRVREQIKELLEFGDTPHSYSQLVRILRSTRALDRSRALAFKYIVKAKQQLMLLPYSEARQRLQAVADMALERDY